MSDTGSRADSRFGALLRHYRGLRGMTQGELAAKAGLNLHAISMLERGLRRSPRSTTVEFLAQALNLDTQQREAFMAAANGRPDRKEPSAGSPASEPIPVPDAPDRLADAALLASMPTESLPPRGPLPAGSRMPLAANPLFVGRSDELLQVARAVKDGGTVALGQVVASTGLGGLGKTQLAAELVHRYGRFFSGGVYWLSFASAEEIPLQVAGFAGPGLDERLLAERVQLVKDEWQRALPRLLIFDNCEDEALLEAWRPPSGGCRVLVTSRRSYWSPTMGVTALPLDLLPRPDSIELLRRYRPDLAPGDPRLDAIADRLGDLPLALHLAGRYLLAYRTEISLDDYLAELDQPALIQHASLLGEGLDDSPSPTHHVQSLAATFALCLGRLDREREVDRVAIALLARMAWMAPGEAVPRDLLGRALEEVGPRRRADGLRRLGSAGLIEEGDGWLRLHRLLVHFVRQAGLDPEARESVDLTLIGCGQDAEVGDLTGSALAAVIPHLIEAAAAAVGDTTDALLAAKLCNAAGFGLRRAGDLGAARPWFERALDIRQREMGPHHPDTAQGLNDLGLLLLDAAKLDAARPLLERALAIREHVLGPDHYRTAESLSAVGVLLHASGDLTGARRVHERALAIRERVLGPEHADTAKSLNNVAAVLLAHGELVSARPLFERALNIHERVLGPDHPLTAFDVNGLARVLRTQGELDVAGLLFERALDIRKRVQGPDHPDTAISLNDLGTVRRAQGDLVAARQFFERALDIRERVLGHDHPDTAISLNDLALLYRTEGKLDAARPLLERALDIRQRTVGPNHPFTARSLYGLALVHRGRGDPAGARPLFERGLAIQGCVLGPDHPDTVATRRALAELAKGDDGPAEG